MTVGSFLKMVEAAVQFSPTKPPGQWAGKAKKRNPASIATMMSASSRVKKICNTSSGGRRSSPRFVNKNLELVERNSSTSIKERIGKKRQRLDDEKEDSEASIVPAKTVANGIDGSKDNPALIAPGMNAHYLVVKTLRTFNRHYLHFVQVCIHMFNILILVSDCYQ